MQVEPIRVESIPEWIAAGDDTTFTGVEKLPGAHNKQAQQQLVTGRVFRIAIARKDKTQRIATVIFKKTVFCCNGTRKEIVKISNKKS
jgi:hypothetical protein